MVDDQQKKMQVVLLGLIGSGKTSLYNKITNSNETVQAGGDSVTMSVFMKQAPYASIPFNVLDTPGIGSSMKKVDHVAGILAAMTEGPVNRIIVVVKFDRLDTMRKNVVSIIFPFQRYKELITILVTHWDQQKDQEKENNMSRIKETFMKYNITSLVFTHKDESAKIVCENILNQIRLTDASKVELFESEYTQFDLAEFQEELELEVKSSQAALKKIFRAKARSIKQFIEKYSSNSKSLSDVMHILTLESKRMAEETLQKFETDNFELCNRMVAESGASIVYLLHTLLKKEIEQDLQDITQCAQFKMKSVNTHCFNFIKKCPHCGLIWMKVQGCNYGTWCGKPPDEDEFIQKEDLKKWQIKWSGNEIVDVILNYNNQVDIGQKLKKSEIPFEYKGCKKQIYWENMDPLTEGELKELIDPGLLDYFCNEDKIIAKKHEAEIKPFKDQLDVAIKAQKAKIKRG